MQHSDDFLAECRGRKGMRHGHTLDAATADALRQILDEERGCVVYAANRLRIGRHTIERALAGLPIRITTQTAIRLAVAADREKKAA